MLSFLVWPLRLDNRNTREGCYELPSGRLALAWAYLHWVKENKGA